VKSGRPIRGGGGGAYNFAETTVRLRMNFDFTRTVRLGRKAAFTADQ